MYELFEHTADAVFGIDENRQVRFWNDSCENLLGLPSRRAIGRPCAELICGEDLRGNKVCGRGCPIARFHDRVSPNTNFDLILKNTQGHSIMVNVGSYYSDKPDRKHNAVRVFHSMRKVDSHQLIQRLSNGPCSSDHDIKKINRLSKREYELLKLLSKGTVTSNIASQLDISPATVRNHVKNIYAKLEVHSRAEAVTYAINNGML